MTEEIVAKRASIALFGADLFADHPYLQGVIVEAGLLPLPVTVAIAILRYRLYEIDRIVSRTITYALLTALLGGVYIGLVFLLGELLPFEGELAVAASTLAVAASTLAVAALFNPARHRVQGVVDRRFNRSHYDAVRTIEAFSSRLLPTSTSLTSARRWSRSRCGPSNRLPSGSGCGPKHRKLHPSNTCRYVRVLDWNVTYELRNSIEIEYINVEGWENSARRFNLTPLVRVGALILISGASGGTDSLDPEEQFTAAFDDVAETLAAANATWDDVVKMTTYHQGGLSRHLDVLLRVKDHFVKPPYPAWTGVGVTELANPHALVEIDVIALASD